MSGAPQGVVDALAKAWHRAQATGMGWESYSSSYWDYCREVAQPMADAAYAASLRAAAERIDGGSSLRWHHTAKALRRWADESEAE